MRRRDFVASAGAAAGTLSILPTASAAQASNALSAVEFKRLGLAVQGGFGSGFTLRSAKRCEGRIKAVIEHNENYLEVASSDLVDWTVLRATEM